MRYGVHKIWLRVDGLLWPSPLTYDPQNLIRSSGINEYSLSVLSQLFKLFMRYRGNNIWPDERESLKHNALVNKYEVENTENWPMPGPTTVSDWPGGSWRALAKLYVSIIRIRCTASAPSDVLNTPQFTSERTDNRQTDRQTDRQTNTGENLTPRPPSACVISAPNYKLKALFTRSEIIKGS